MKKVVCLIAMSVLLVKCDNVEIKEEYHSNGVLKSTVTLTDGRKSGVLKEYYSNGKLKAKIEFKDDRQDGKSYRYYPEGKVAEDFTYYKGNLIGVNKFYGRSGLLKEIREYDTAGHMIDLKTFTTTGEEGYENPVPIVYTNKDTFRLHDNANLYVRLASADPHLFKTGTLIITSGFTSKKTAIDTLYVKQFDNLLGCSYKFRTLAIGNQKITGSMIFPIANDTARVDAIFNFEYKYYVK